MVAYTAAHPWRHVIATPILSPSDQSISKLVAVPNPSTVADVIALMKSLDGLFASGDGLRWFNRLYLMVTEQVYANPPGGAWQNPAWLLRLDVVFAGFYFDALRSSLAGQAVPSAWKAVFESRFHQGLDRIQFAVAGMNAHINHDLALALVQTNAEMNVVPAEDSSESRDYQSVNILLNTIMPAALTMLAGDALGEIAEDTGMVGRLLAFWNICAARDMAWQFANYLSGLPSEIRPTALEVQDRITGALGRAILAQS